MLPFWSVRHVGTGRMERLFPSEPCAAHPVAIGVATKLPVRICDSISMTQGFAIGAPVCGFISGRGHDQAHPHVLGDIDAGIIGKHAAVRNSERQFAASYLAHINLIPNTPDFRLLCHVRQSGINTRP